MVTAIFAISYVRLPETFGGFGKFKVDLIPINI
jgi:hypothetical protein